MTYELDSRSDIRNQHLVGETVILSDKTCAGLVDSTLTAGTLKLAHSNGRPILLRSTLKDTDVIAVKPQRGYQLLDARFTNCRFHGVFSGVDFGCSHDAEPHGNFGSIEDCDFTDATLDGCRFVNLDVTTLQLPSWPHVVIIEPYKRAADVAAMQWPGQLGLYMHVSTSRPESFKSVVLHVPSLARLVKCTENEIRTAFERFGGLLP